MMMHRLSLPLFQVHRLILGAYLGASIVSNYVKLSIHAVFVEWLGSLRLKQSKEVLKNPLPPLRAAGFLFVECF